MILATEILFTFVYAVFYLSYEVLPILRKETGDRLYSLSAYYVSLVVLMVRERLINSLMIKNSRQFVSRFPGSFLRRFCTRRLSIFRRTSEGISRHIWKFPPRLLWQPTVPSRTGFFFRAFLNLSSLELSYRRLLIWFCCSCLEFISTYERCRCSNIFHSSSMLMKLSLLTFGLR